MSLLVRAVYLTLTLLLPLAVTATTSELFEFPKFLILLAASTIVLFAILLDWVATRRLALPLGRYPKITYGVLAILITQGLATLTSIHPYTSFWGYYSRFHQGILSTVCYTILYFGALKFLSLKDIHKLLKVSLVAASLIALLAVLERFDLSATCPLINPSLSQEVRPAPLSRAYFNNSCWKNLTNPTSRSFATLGQPNWLAAYLLPHVFLLLSFFVHKKRISYPLIACYLLLVTAVLFSKSRSGYLGLGIGLLTYLYLLTRQGLPLNWRRLLALVLVPPLLLGLALLPRQKEVSPSPAAATTTSPTEASTSSGEIRRIVWSGALKLLQKRPLLGFGPETFAYTYYQVRPVAHNYTTEWDYLYNKAHNEYLNYAATSGLIGLAAYLYWHWAILKTSLTRVAKSKKVRHEAESFLSLYLPVLGATLVSFAVTNFFGFSVVPVYLVMTLAAAYASTSPTITNSQPSKFATLLVPLVAVVVAAILPLRLYLADVHYNRAKAYTASNHAEVARSELQEAIRLRPHEDLYHSLLGETLASLGDEAGAKAEIDITLTHNPYHLNYYKSRAKAWLTLAERTPALYSHVAKELEEARRLAPTDPKLAYNLALVYSRLGDNSRAIDELQAAIALKTDYYEPYYALTLLYESTKQKDEIPPLLEEARIRLKIVPEPLEAKMLKYLQ